MQIHRPTSETSSAPPEPTFTGEVAISGYFRRSSPSRLAGASVTYAPSARTPWKRNPAGQTVVVTHGCGRAQADGEDVVEIEAGDILWFAPDVPHWEGATPESAMTCVVMQESQDGWDVAFGAAVTDEEYHR